MTTRLLNLSGLYIDDEQNLFPAGKGNEKGHWEHEEVLSINEEILKRLGGTDLNVPHFPNCWEKDEKFDDLKILATQFVDTMNSKSSVWGFKEPRTCLTLPFWQAIISNMKYIVPTRDVGSVAKSLQKRNSLDFIYGETLWAQYWDNIFKYTNNKNRLLVVFDKVVDNWQQELNRMLDFIGDDDLNFENKIGEIDEFIDPNLKHYKSPLYYVPYDLLEEEIINMVEYVQDKSEYVQKLKLDIDAKITIIQQKQQEINKKDNRFKQEQQKIEQKDQQLQQCKQQNKKIYNSKSFKLGDLFFRSMKKPRKLVTMPINVIKILMM